MLRQSQVSSSGRFREFVHKETRVREKPLPQLPRLLAVALRAMLSLRPAPATRVGAEGLFSVLGAQLTSMKCDLDPMK